MAQEKFFRRIQSTPPIGWIMPGSPLPPGTTYNHRPKVSLHSTLLFFFRAPSFFFWFALSSRSARHPSSAFVVFFPHSFGPFYRMFFPFHPPLNACCFNTKCTPPVTIGEPPAFVVILRIFHSPFFSTPPSRQFLTPLPFWFSLLGFFGLDQTREFLEWRLRFEIRASAMQIGSFFFPSLSIVLFSLVHSIVLVAT